MKAKVLLVDAPNLFRPVFHVNPPADDSQAELDALSARCRASLRQVVKGVQPTHMACVFEGEGPNWRHELYPEYKANRETPELFTKLLPILKAELRTAGVGVLEKAGEEADDVIASTALQMAHHDISTVISSTDKDFYQLLSELRITVWHHPSRSFRDHMWLMSTYDIAPEQFADALALMGDDSDNIPGCPLVAEKTAARLLDRWDSLDNLLEHVDEVPGKVGENLAKSADQLKLSRKLVSLKCDM